MADDSPTLYEQLGGYDAINAVVEDFIPRMMADPKVGRFWKNRGQDGIHREKQLLKDYLCNATGGPMYYTGRDMKTTHVGMQIDDADWSVLIENLTATLNKFEVPEELIDTVLGFINSLKGDIVE